jgi:hypothetical protein
MAGEPGLGLVTPASKVPWDTKNASNRQRTRCTPGVIQMDQGNTIKKDVQEFYDNVGWDKSDDGFSDASIYEDLRPVAAEYIHRCHQRVKQHLPDSGRYLLDVASGQFNMTITSPIPRVTSGGSARTFPFGRLLRRAGG